MSGHQLGQFDSWEIITEDIARKTCDKSFFKYHGSGVPQGIRWFFDADNIPAGQSKTIVLVYDGFEYDGFVQMDNQTSSRTRIFWSSALAKEFEAYFKDDSPHVLEFHREEGGRFKVKFVDLPSVGKRASVSVQKGLAMREAIEKLMRGYQTAKNEVFANNPFGEFVRKDIPALFYKTGLIDKDKYLITGSVGQGNWAMVPWICIFDRSITTSATKGEYIVYLLSKDCSELYLTFNQGCTEIRKAHSKKETISIMREKAGKIAKQIDNHGFLEDENISLGEGLTELGLLYQKGTIFYKKYEVDAVPDDNELLDDLSKMMDIYQSYATLLLNKDNEWWPVLEDYNPGITKEQWIEILNNPELVGPIWGGILAKFYDYGGAATCSQIAERYGGNPMSVSGNCTQFAKAIQKATDCVMYDAGDDRNRYWPILFQGRKATSEEKGNWVWKFRPELKEALDEVDILRFLQEEGEPEMQISIKEAIDQIKSYIAAKGFTYDGGLIENFYLSLKSKPFVILAGTSGTGKTRLVKLFAEAIGADYKMVSVRPDWSDGSDLFGHTDLNGNFINGPICDAFDRAVAEPTKPVLLCLDEMNLARVEYYLSDFLSVIESRERTDDGKVLTDPIAQYKEGIPENLYIIGTVNMDETTFPFSKKVLDRANTIEFSYVDLLPGFDALAADAEPLHLSNDFLRTQYLVLATDCGNEKAFVVEVCDELQKVNAILRNANAHVGYRVRDEIVFYMLNNKNAENLLTYEQAFDNEIMQKILPRIQGSQTAIKNLLVELFKYCMGNYSGLDTESGNAGKQMQAMADSAKYPESAKKIGYMMTRYEEDGFTSYWL